MREGQGYPCYQRDMMMMIYMIKLIDLYTKVEWLFGFYGISTLVGYLTPNPFLYIN